MEQKFLDQIKEKLLQEKERLERELDKFSQKVPAAVQDGVEAAFPDYGDKEDENAEEVAAYSANLSLERNLEDARRDVEAALKRLAEGKYGICKYCGQPIAEKRLLARPVSSACIDCKKKFKGEK